MNIHLRASLADKLAEWVKENCESDIWIDTYLGAETANLMADAAATVLDAVVEIQEYGLAQGFFSHEV